MFYKHWKKIALALTGFFWASCDDSASSAVCLYGPDPNYSNPAENPTSSSSEATKPESSSSFEQIMPAYGVPDDTLTNSSSSEAVKPESSSSNDFDKMMPLYGVEMDKTVCTQIKGEPTITCEDGTVCTQKTEEHWGNLPCSDDICPAYGVVQISENTYECDGKVYNEAKFRARFGKITVVEEPQDTLFTQEPVLYGPPCVFDGTCDDEKE